MDFSSFMIPVSGFVERLLAFLPEFVYRQQILWASLVSAGIGFGRAGWLTWKSFWVKDPIADRNKAEQLAKSGKHKSAKNLFMSVGAYRRAAEMALRLNESIEAADLFLKSGDAYQAAQQYAKGGQAENAAVAYEKAGRAYEAAVAWEECEELEKALGAYQKAGNERGVENMLLRLERPTELAQLYLKQFYEAHQSLDPNPNPNQLQFVKSLAVKTAQTFSQMGEGKKAIQVYLKAGMLIESAQLLVQAGDHVRAADLYRQASRLEDAARTLEAGGHFDFAAEVYEELGMTGKMTDLMEKAGRVEEAKKTKAHIALQEGDSKKAAQLLVDAGQRADAAEIFASMGEFERAAELWEQEGDFFQSGGLYEQAGNLKKAAQLYAKGNESSRAAVCFEKLGDLRRAAAEYEDSGDLFKAAELSERLGLVDRAISLYQKMSLSGEESWKVRHALARLFWRKGLTEMAEQQFAELGVDTHITPEQLEASYDYAVFLEGTGKLDKSHDIYEGILKLNFHFRDVFARKQSLKERIGSSPSPDYTTQPPAATAPQSTQAFVPALGDVLAERYQLEKEVGQGAMGVIYKGMDLKLRRPVAMKFVTGTLSGDEVTRLLQEGKLAGKLTHPNIVATYDVGKHRNCVFLIMEFVDGPNLSQILKKRGPFPIAVVVQAGKEMAGALSCAHMQKVVHRDIKSANILWTKEKTVKVADFGLARVLQEGLVAKTQTIGSPLYMAPEQIIGEAFDHRIDLYSLGVVLYELAVGRTPFVDGEVTHHHLHTPPKSPREFRKEIPEPLEELILRLLQKNPDERFQSADAVLEALEQLSLSKKDDQPLANPAR